MFLSLREYQVDPANITEIIRRVQGGFVPLIDQSPGFIAFYAVDMGGGKLVSISIFQDQAGADASAQLSAEHIRRNLAELFPAPPRVLTGDVRIHHSHL